MNAAVSDDPVAAARAAGLRYITDDRPGIQRKKSRGGFEYVGLNGKPIRDQDELKRIRALAVPPAYENVWISPIANGHLQATGRDARGRKQYRYHKRWREVRDESKFDRMLAFSKALPTLRDRLEEDIARPGLPREKVLATVVRLLELTLIRVGNDEYAKTNHSYGLTTLRNKHVRVDGSKVQFHFRGKSGVDHAVGIRDRRLATIVKRLLDIPGQELFQYVDDDGDRQDVSSQDVNAYLRDVTGEEFTAKDFRTLAGTVFCAVALSATEAATTHKDARDRVNAAVKTVAQRLGNTPTVCRKSYIHPAIIDEYLASGTLKLVAESVEKQLAATHAIEGDERVVVTYLEKLLQRDESEHVTSLLERSVEHATAKKSPKRKTAGGAQTKRIGRKA